MPFCNREDELDALETRWQRGRGEFFVASGRRRVGKTELLSAFLEGKRGFHFEAIEGLELDHSHEVSTILVDETASLVLAAQGLSNWQAALAPFDFKGAGLFFPSWSAEDRMCACAVQGGMPYYLDRALHQQGCLSRVVRPRPESRSVLNPSSQHSMSFT